MEKNIFELTESNLENSQARNIFNNTDGTPGINACGDGSSGLSDANRSSETAVGEARKSKHCEKRKEEALKIAPFKA